MVNLCDRNVKLFLQQKSIHAHSSVLDLLKNISALSTTVSPVSCTKHCLIFRIWPSHILLCICPTSQGTVHLVSLRCVSVSARVCVCGWDIGKGTWYVHGTSFVISLFTGRSWNCDWPWNKLLIPHLFWRQEISNSQFQFALTLSICLPERGLVSLSGSLWLCASSSPLTAPVNLEQSVFLD